jgi:magnesium and cobalt transporter
MSEDSTSSQAPLGWMDRLFQVFGAEPKDKEQLIDLLRDAKDRDLFDVDALTMIEGVLQVSELRVRDIMIPRAQMVVVARDDPFEAILPSAIDSAHSRFPVIGEDKGEVVGIMLAKDLLRYCGNERPRFNIRDLLRSAVYVPESKRLNVLLKEFRASRNHMAIVIDEYGDAAGLVTIEDVLEQIVGEIEDEHDFDEGTPILKRSKDTFTAKAHTSIDDFNDYFGSDFADDDFDTIGGLVVNALGHLPKRGERVKLGRFHFKVLRSDSRRIHLLDVKVEQSMDDGEP